jgi:hypothetical protein
MSSQTRRHRIVYFSQVMIQGIRKQWSCTMNPEKNEYRLYRIDGINIPDFINILLRVQLNFSTSVNYIKE